MILLSALACAPVQTGKGLQPAATTLAALQQARAPRRHALVIGVDPYGDPTFPTLRHAGDDARELAAQLRSPQVGGFDEVTVLTGSDTHREQILDALREIRDTLRRDDVLVVYFSGHGTRARDTFGTWHRYLVPTDGKAADLAGTALDLAEIQAFFTSLAPARKALIVDACFDGDGRSVVAPDSGPAPDLPLVPTAGAIGPGEAHLFATSAGRPAREDDALGHGVYTWFLLDAMSWSFAEADVDADRVLTAWEAHDWARGQTMERTDGAQIPEAAFRIVGEADVVLAGDPDPRRRSDRALVYLYPTETQDWSGAALLVDGREKGALPKTVPLPPGRHHFLIREEDGNVAVDGYLRLAGGRAYTVDEVARLAQGPTAAFGARVVGIPGGALSESVGDWVSGAELYWADRRRSTVGRGFTGDLAVGGAVSPEREGFTVARPLGYAAGMAGWQGDRGRLRLRVGLGLSAVWIPPNFPAGRPETVEVGERPGEVGWWFLAGGPTGSAGWVLGNGWSAVGTVRPHLAWLDVDFDGRASAVGWTAVSIGLEVDR